MKVNSKHFTLLISAVILLILTSFAYWYIYKATISNVQESITIEQELNNSEQNISQEAKLLELSSSTSKRRAIVSSYFVTEDKILDFIKSIENVATDSDADVTLSSVSFDNLSDKGVGIVGRARVHVAVHGDWTSVNKALSLIENLPYSISISSITLNSGAVESVSTDKVVVSKKNLWSLSMDVTALTIK